MAASCRGLLRTRPWRRGRELAGVTPSHGGVLTESEQRGRTSTRPRRTQVRGSDPFLFFAGSRRRRAPLAGPKNMLHTAGSINWSSGLAAHSPASGLAHKPNFWCGQATVQRESQRGKSIVVSYRVVRLCMPPDWMP
jgi:hypothetical protein